MTGIGPEMEAKLASIGFRENTVGLGLGMRMLVEQVEIGAIEGPRGLQLTFTAHGSRTHIQYETCAPLIAEADAIANLIALNLSMNFQEFMGEAQKTGEA